jgi:hypothetical protein
VPAVPCRRVLPPGQLALAFAGMLLGHAAGYAVAAATGTMAGVSHAHLDVLLDVGLPLGVVALLLLALTEPRRIAGARDVTVARLAGLQSLLFVGLETLERLVQGAGPGGLLSTAVVVGFLAQLLVATVVVLLVGATRRFVRRILLLLSTSSPARRPAPSSPPPRLQDRGLGRSLGARAPPVARISVAHR